MKLLSTLRDANREQMLSVWYLRQLGFTDADIKSANDAGYVVVGSGGAFASVVLTIDGLAEVGDCND